MNIETIKLGDVFDFSWNPDDSKTDKNWCFDGQLVVKEDYKKELVLIDTYWNSGDNHIFTLEEAQQKGKLTFKFNLADVKEIGKECQQYYNPKDIFNFSYQHGCYKRWVVKKDAKKSKDIMIDSVNKKISEARHDADYAIRQIELLTATRTKIESGDLEQYI